LQHDLGIQGSVPTFKTEAIEEIGQFFRSQGTNRFENVQRFTFKHQSRYIRIICNMWTEAETGGNMAFDVYTDDEETDIASGVVTETRTHSDQGYRKELLLDLGVPTGDLLVMYWRIFSNVNNTYTYGSVRYIVRER